jgi:peptidoglycan/LPS O-acetylase OafA/YrhL
MVTPIVRAARQVDALPALVQWYLRPSGQQTTFTLFPWAGFVFAGGAVGALLAACQPHRERRLHAEIALAGAALVALGFYAAARPSLYPTASFWTSSPTWFGIRAGVLMMALAGLYGLELLGQGTGLRRVLTPLETLGRSSLFVYWIHVELVYGYTTWVIHRRLPLWGTLTAWAVFSAAMYGAVILRDRLSRAWRRRDGRGASERDQVGQLRHNRPVDQLAGR